MDDYSILMRVPSSDDYRRLRAVAGLTPRSAAATAAGLPNTFIGVVAESRERAIGMGRIIGDGGLFFQMVDIAVEPEHQGRGIGRAIVGALMAALGERVPAEAYVSLMADGAAHRLYAGFGFEPVAPGSVGMARWLR